MATFTSSLPDDLLKELASLASELNIPKNRLIENALKAYLKKVKKAKYAASFKRMANDPDMIQMAEEGLQEWEQELKRIENEEG